MSGFLAVAKMTYKQDCSFDEYVDVQALVLPSLLAGGGVCVSAVLCYEWAVFLLGDLLKSGGNIDQSAGIGLFFVIAVFLCALPGLVKLSRQNRDRYAVGLCSAVLLMALIVGSAVSHI